MLNKKITPTIVLALFLSLTLLTLGCTAAESNAITPPFTACQLINKIYEPDLITRASCAKFYAGDYNNYSIMAGGSDGNVLVFFDTNAGTPAGYTSWGSITGVLENQNDLWAYFQDQNVFLTQRSDFDALVNGSSCMTGYALQTIGETPTCVAVGGDVNLLPYALLDSTNQPFTYNGFRTLDTQNQYLCGNGDCIGWNGSGLTYGTWANDQPLLSAEEGVIWDASQHDSIYFAQRKLVNYDDSKWGINGMDCGTNGYLTLNAGNEFECQTLPDINGSGGGSDFNGQLWADFNRIFDNNKWISFFRDANHGGLKGTFSQDTNTCTWIPDGNVTPAPLGYYLEVTEDSSPSFTGVIGVWNQYNGSCGSYTNAYTFGDVGYLWKDGTTCYLHFYTGMTCGQQIGYGYENTSCTSNMEGTYTGYWGGTTGSVVVGAYDPSFYQKSLKLDSYSGVKNTSNTSIWDLQTKDFTLSYWIKGNSFSDNVYFFDNGGNGTLMRYRSGNLTAEIGAEVIYICNEPVTLNANQWYNIELDRNEGNFYMFLDGEEICENTTLTEANFGQNSTMTIGGFGGSGGYGLNGNIDEFRLVVDKAEHTTDFNVNPMPYADGNVLLHFDRQLLDEGIPKRVWEVAYGTPTYDVNVSPFIHQPPLTTTTVNVSGASYTPANGDYDFVPYIDGTTHCTTGSLNYFLRTAGGDTDVLYYHHASNNWLLDKSCAVQEYYSPSRDIEGTYSGSGGGSPIVTLNTNNYGLFFVNSNTSSLYGGDIFDKQVSDDFSMSFWYVGDDSSTNIFLSKEYSCNAEDQGWCLWYSGGVVFVMRDGTNYEIRRVTNAVLDNNYHMITLVHTGGSTSGYNIKIYIDGVEGNYDYTDSSGTISDSSNSENFRVFADGTGRYRTGELDSLALYDKALDGTEIAALYNNNLGTWSPPTTSLFDFFPMNEGTGTSTTTGINSTVLNLSYSPNWFPSAVHDAVEQPLIANYPRDANAYYMFDEYNGVAYNSTNGDKNGIVSNVNRGQLGKIKNSYEFDGSTSQVTVPEGINYSSNAPFTYTLWLNPKSGGSNDYRFIYADTSNNLNIGLYNPSGSIIGVILYLGGNNRTISSLSIPFDEWGFWTFSYNGTSLLTYYNGELIDTWTVSYSAFSSDLHIGGRLGDVLFKGNIDEVGVWTRSLSTEEVASVYNNGYATAFQIPPQTITNNFPAGALVHYAFEYDYTDSTDNGNDGTNYGTSFNTGKIGEGIYTAASMRERVATPSGETFNLTTAVSLNIWAKISNYSSGILIFGKEYYTTVPYTIMTEGGSLHFGFYNGGYTRTNCSYSGLDNSWHMLTGTFDGASLKMYIDGTLCDTVSYSGSLPSDTNPVWVGAGAGWHGQTQGYLDEATVWGRAITSDEVTNLYNSGDGLPYGGGTVDANTGHYDCNVTSTQGQREIITMDNNGDITISNDLNAIVTINGNTTINGKITATGGIDPPFVTYDAHTRDEIKSLVLAQVPKEKQSGASLFYNIENHKIEYYVATEDKFYNMNGDVVKDESKQWWEFWK